MYRRVHFLRSGKVLPLKLCRRPKVFHNDYYSFSMTDPWWNVLVSSLWDLVGFLAEKPMQVGAPQELWLQGYLGLILTDTETPAIYQICHWSVPIILWLPVTSVPSNQVFVSLDFRVFALCSGLYWIQEKS